MKSIQMSQNIGKILKGLRSWILPEIPDLGFYVEYLPAGMSEAFYKEKLRDIIQQIGPGWIIQVNILPPKKKSDYTQTEQKLCEETQESQGGRTTLKEFV